MPEFPANPSGATAAASVATHRCTIRPEVSPRVWRSLVLACALFLVAGSEASLAGQDLFKKGGGLADAFSKGGSNKQQSNQSFYTFEQMEKLVLGSGFENTEKITERAYQFDFEYDGWTIPTIIELSKSNTNLWVTMILDYPELDVMKHPDRLWKLLENSGAFGDCFFTVSSSTKAITLSGALQLNGPTDDEKVKEHLQYLAAVAVETEELWNTETWSDAPQHVGTWTSTGDISMTITFERTGNFELVDSSNSTTTGAYTINADKIEMTETDGETIAGKIEFSDANNFNLEVNGNVISFVRK